MFSASLFSASTEEAAEDFVPNIQDNTVKIGNLTYTIAEFSLRGGKFRQLMKMTTEYKQLTNDHTKDLALASHMSLKMKVSGGDVTMGGNATLHTKSGKITLSGGYIDCNQKNEFNGLNSQPKNLLKAFLKLMGLSDYDHGAVKVSNVTLNSRIPYELKGLRAINGYRMENPNPELNTTHRIVYSLPSGAVVRVSYSKKNKLINLAIQSGLKTKADVDAAVRETKTLVSKMEAVGMIKRVTGLVAPAPRGGKVTRRVRGNVAAPNVTRRGTTCPPSKRPVPETFEGKCRSGHYARPNPQGNPCCYKLPKNLKHMSTKIKGYYDTAGVKVPTTVKALFPDVNFDNANRNKNRGRNKVNVQIQGMKAKIRNAEGKMQEVNTIRIGSRQCERYTKQQLVDIVSRMERRADAKVKGAPGGLDFSRMKKEQLCEFIKAHHTGTSANKTTNKYTSGFVFGGKFKELKPGVIGRRVASTYTKPELVKFAHTLQIAVTNSLPKTDILRAIEAKRVSMNAAMNQKRKNNAVAVDKRKANKVHAAKNATNRNVSIKRRAEIAKANKKAREAENRARSKSLKAKQKLADQERRAKQRAIAQMKRELDKRMDEARQVFHMRAIRANKVVNMNAFNNALRADPLLIKANDSRPGAAWKRERFMPWVKKYITKLNTNKSNSLNSFAASLERMLENKKSAGSNKSNSLNSFAASLERMLENNKNKNKK